MTAERLFLLGYVAGTVATLLILVLVGDLGVLAWVTAIFIGAVLGIGGQVAVGRRYTLSRR